MLIKKRVSSGIRYRLDRIIDCRTIKIESIMAEQIKSFGMSQLSIGATSDFHTHVYGLIEAATPAVLHVEELAVRYKQAKETLAGVVNRRTAYVSTAQLREADNTRDNGAGTIINVVGAHEKSLIAAKREAALRLQAELAPYRQIRYHEYSKQTAEGRGMIAVLREADNAAAVTLLGLDDEVDAFEEANNAFEELFKRKAAEESERMPVKDLDSFEVVKEANTLYEQITQIVNAYAIVSPTDEINAFIKDVNGFVGVFARIASGGTSGGTATTEPEPTPGEEGGETPGGEEPDPETPEPGGEETDSPSVI